MATLSELEGVVLGIVHTQEPCTPYAVRRHLMTSPSAHWSGSAGSIYPLIERLESGGLLASATDASDRRGRRLLRLSAKGRRALRTWVLLASDAEVAATVFDAVRSRAFFLGALDPEERIRFVAEATRALEAYLATTREHLAGLRPGGFEALAARGAVGQAEARLRWMREVAEELAAHGADRSG